MTTPESLLDEICQHLPPDLVDVKKIRQAIIRTFAGQWVYFPQQLMLSERNRELLKRFFDGESRGNLCREFQISRSQFHRILKTFHAGRHVIKCYGLQEKQPETTLRSH